MKDQFIFLFLSPLKIFIFFLKNDMEVKFLFLGQEQF